MEIAFITGRAGFIGSHLCERLLGEGNDVICLDNYFTGSKDNVCHDVTESFYAEVDERYNLAGPALPVHYQYNPIKTSFYGAMNRLGLAKRTRVKILQASTSEVYGDGLQTRSFQYVAEKVVAMTGTSSKIVFEPRPCDDPKQRKPDISLACK